MIEIKLIFFSNTCFTIHSRLVVLCCILSIVKGLW